MDFPTDRQYTPEHEWIDGEGRVGITEYAQDALGDVVFVELPEVGRAVQAGDGFGVVESVKSVSDLFSPVTGVVDAVNQELTEHPERINQDPYGSGWMVKIKVAAGREGLMSAEQYRSQVEGGS
jgi:glycine cleavage system H protein